MSNAWDNDKLVYVDMTDQSVTVKDYPQEWKLLGGRALSTRILLNECDPQCDPLGPENVLVLAPGVLSGTSAPTSGRLSVGCKSPLTGGIKEANVGGNPGQDLMKLGIRAVVVKGQPKDTNALYGLEIVGDEVKVVDATDYKGMWNYAGCEKLFGNYEKTASAISIGPAGEMLLKGASVACTDKEKERHPARQAARGGVGAVMGSKKLKWVLVDPGKKPIRKPADQKAFNAWMKEFSQDYLNNGRHEQFKWGTSAAVPFANMMNTFPYKNRTEGQNPEFEGLDGAKIVASFEQRGGGMHACMNGCIVKCSNVVHDEKGNYVTSALEFETLTLLGSCCDINSWEEVADLDRLCDELGLDTIETGAAIAVLMDAGGMKWGDAEAAKELLAKKIEAGDKDALLVANGAAAVGKDRNHARTPVSRGQAMPAWDPRPLKATGITYCTSAQGADHTAGLVIDPEINGEEAAVASQRVQIVNAVTDSSGFCMFLLPNLDEIRKFYSLFYGEEISREQIADLGWQCLEEEWEFNRGAGFTDADDDMADCLKEEGVGPDHSIKFDIPAEIIAKAKVKQPYDDALFGAGASG
ncbi:MAG: aldehyde ferredoxin oxidoreductase N-terminal domain-containing protein [Gammaproteobacteria bacterium]